MTNRNGKEIVLERISETEWEIPQTGKMNVPGRIYVSDDLIDQARSEGG